MIKYLAVACLCLMAVLVQSEEQETTTDRRVERDLDMQNMPADMLALAKKSMSDAATGFAEGMEAISNAAKGMMPNANGGGFGTARRRRTPQNPQPPKPQKPPMAQA